MTTQVNDLSKITIFIEKDLESMIVDVRKEVRDRVARKTPVLSGRARDGWEIEGTKVINKVPYIGALEQGTSAKAPNGMVGTTLVEIDGIIKEILNKQ